MPVPVTVYTREDCHRCDDAIDAVERIADEEEIDIDLDIVDVGEDPELDEEYGTRVPYVFVDGRPAFKYRVEPPALRSKLVAAVDE